jgi:phage minor structural protein, N-terminal region
MAYPILYKANETNFEHLGVSVLSDASKCHVSREKNGIYILEFDYPINGKDVEKIKEGMYIKSDAGYRTKNQRFIVSKITKTQNEFKIYCQHISQVKTTMNAIRPDITVTSVSAVGALRAWRDNLLDSREEFFVQSDISTLNSTTWKVENIENARDALGGKAGSILDVWGGEYEFDNLNITLHRSMGIDNPTIIAYGKNLLDLEQEQSILETYTSVFPFKKYTDDNNREQLITLPEILLDSTHLNKFTHRRILKVDFSSDENLKTVEQLRSKAKSYIKSNNVGVPKTNLKINYQDLSKVEGVFDNPALEQIDLCDRLKVYYNELGILNENAKVVKVIWDVILEENHEIEVGDGRSSFTDSTSAKLESLQVQNDSVLARINALVAEQEAAFDRFFKEKSKVIEDKVKGGYEKALLSSEEKIRKMGEAFDEKINQFREQVSTAVENYNRQFQATNLEISKNRVEATKQIQAVNLEISKSRIEATKQIQALTDRVNNIQDISNNETVRELRGLVNGATSKVTELETSITREFTAVKKKNEDGLSAVKAEFQKGVDGLTSKITSLEEYKNQDSTRTETLKQWVQRDTANQLSRERTEINRIIDNKGFVKNTEFSSKFTESARGITNQLTVLENYKNQDGVRVANMQMWVQNNTANQLTAARRSIESWVNEKGYATASVVENKVQETANSFSREISNVRNIIPTSVGGRNYITDSKNLNSKNFYSWNKWDKSVSEDTIILTKVNGSDTYGFYFNLTDLVKTQFQNEMLTWSIEIKASRNMTLSNVGFETNGLRQVDITTGWQRISHTFNNKFTNVFAFVFYNPTANFNNGDKIYIRLPKLEKGNIATDWTPAPEDVETNVNELNTWKQTTSQTLNTVTSTLNDTVRHSQLRVGADGIDFGSNKVFNGRNLASILSISPESIQAITNKLIITPANENLVKSEYRRNSSFTKDMQISEDFDIGKTTDFLVKGKARTNSYENRFRFAIKIIYKDGTSDFVTGVDSATYINGGMFSVPFKINEREKEIKNAYFTIDRYGTPIFDELSIVPQKSAELIVDGSIEGRQIKTETLETGHHKAGSITSEIIAANAVRAKHILIDDGLINNLVTHNAFISKLWAQDAFIRSLKTVKISTTQLDTDWLSAYTGDIGGFRIGKNPNQPGDFWLTGSNNFNCGLNPGHNIGTRGAQIWAAWGYNWNQAGPNAWWVDGQGRMNCKSSATFYGGLHVYNARLDTHGQDIQGDANSYGAKTTVIWWSQINRVKSSVSDKRFKTNIKPTKVKAVDLLNKIEMVEFNWKKDNKFEKIGAIAQQVQSVEKSLVVKDMDSKQSHSDYLRISYYDAIPYLIKAVQELSEENNKLKNKLEELING